MRIITLGLLCLVFGAVGCSSDDDDGGSKGNTGGSGGSAGSATGGTGGSSASGGTGGSSASGGSGGTAGSGTGGVAGSSTGGAGGTAGAGSCEDSSNPMFGSCIDAFLVGCYEPDTTGTCTEQAGTTTWSDGSKFVPNGPDAGMYGPGDTQPCISVVVNGGSITATKGTEILTYVPDQSTGMGTITCPDGTSFTAEFPQVTAFNQCKGINCPP